MNDGRRYTIRSPILSNLPPTRPTVSPPFAGGDVVPELAAPEAVVLTVPVQAFDEVVLGDGGGGEGLHGVSSGNGGLGFGGRVDEGVLRRGGARQEAGLGDLGVAELAFQECDGRGVVPGTGGARAGVCEDDGPEVVVEQREGSGRDAGVGVDAADVDLSYVVLSQPVDGVGACESLAGLWDGYDVGEGVKA